MQTSTSLGELAATMPAATRVFLRHRLDFCCGGKQSLADACTTLGLDATKILAEVTSESLQSPDGEIAAAPLAELADYIVTHYHEALRRDVPPLIEAARKVERVHAAKPLVPAGLADRLWAFWDEMQHHMQKEEQILFPIIRNGGRGEFIAGPICVLEKEHDHHGHTLAALRALANDYAAPPHACATWRALYDGLANLEAQLMQHIHLENNALFPRATHG
jgi:regulator of cell morphogenesis and NO signaling